MSRSSSPTGPLGSCEKESHFAVDKNSVSLEERCPTMRTCLKYASLFWAVAILLMAGAQGLDAYQDYTCSKQHASGTRTSVPMQSHSTANHICCHGHSLVTSVLSDAPRFVVPVLTAEFPIDHGTTVVQGPAREIDYPPQLS